MAFILNHPVLFFAAALFAGFDIVLIAHAIFG